MAEGTEPVVDWTRVDTVLLDMDGTLLDLGFDNHFWQELEQTRPDRRLEAIHSAHAFGLPKEHVAFWARLRLVEPFDPARSVLLDDSLAVLRSARRFGIAQVCAITHPDPARAPLDAGELPGTSSVATLLAPSAQAGGSTD